MNSFVIAKNLVRRLLKEPNAILFLVIFPVLGALLAVGITAKPGKIDIGVANVSPEVRPLIQAMEASGSYRTREVDADEMKNQVKDKKVSMGIIFPKDLKQQLSRKQVSGVQLIASENDAKAMELKGVLESFVQAAIAGKVPEPVNNKTERDEGKKLSQRMALGFLTMFMLMFVGTGMGMILEDKKTKTFMRTFCAPVKEYQVVIGNLLASLLTGLIQVAFFLLAARYILQIEWTVPYGSIFLILSAYLVTIIGLGIGLIGFIRSNQVFSLVNSILATVTCMLGGSFFPVDALGEGMKKVSNFIPQKWVMEAFDKLASGNTLQNVQQNVGILVLFGAVFFTFGVTVLKPSEEDL